MGTIILVVNVGNSIDRTDLEMVENQEFEVLQNALDAISDEGRHLYMEGKIRAFELSDFMEAWNNTDDYEEVLNIMGTFIGYIKVKTI